MPPTKSDLHVLISTLEKEKRELKKMTRQAQSEHDNLIVYYHSEALLDLNSRLRVLYSFKDPYFEQKEDLKRQIKAWRSGYYMEEMRAELREWMQKRNEEKAVELGKQLQRLIDRPQLQSYPRTQFIDEALTALYEKRCRSFQLVMGEEDDLHIRLTFRIQKKILTVTLKGINNDDDSDFIFEGRTPQPLKAAGFVHNEEQNKYTRTFNFADAGDIPDVKKWLAKFIIEDSWFYRPGRTMKLEYK
ncbi:hypothetical protein [Mucilaginibacter sp.]|uniref:hypothetical protein n=1 Tax=Mucilaginibacter sp. TaxID=1882438 RepID=UPI00283C8F29|nr:hypothetical protein [Mucilaginibacter sp.]MDR3697593.1 hypothetical protein [Mucilaginibacter sp.]